MRGYFPCDFAPSTGGSLLHSSAGSLPAFAPHVCLARRQPASIPRCRSRMLTTAPTQPGLRASIISSSSRSTASAGTTPSATTPRIFLPSASRAYGRLKACCPAIPRSHFPITSPSSPAFIPSTMASSPTTSSIPRARRRYSMYRPEGRHRRLLVQRHSLVESR